MIQFNRCDFTTVKGWYIHFQSFYFPAGPAYQKNIFFISIQTLGEMFCKRSFIGIPKRCAIIEFVGIEYGGMLIYLPPANVNFDHFHDSAKGSFWYPENDTSFKLSMLSWFELGQIQNDQIFLHFALKCTFCEKRNWFFQHIHSQWPCTVC